jgi:ketosteroid isomerase-like protein
MMSDLEALQAIVTAWDDAMNSGDVEASLALYVDDNPMAMPPNSPTAVGKTAIAEVIAGLHAGGKLTVRDEFSNAHISGDLAMMYGTFTLRVEPEDGPAVDDAGKWSCACERQPDGSWKTLYNIWNSDHPLPE